MHFGSRYARALWLWGTLAAGVLSIWPTWPLLAGTWHDMADYALGPYVVLFLLGWTGLRSLDLPPLASRRLPLATIALIGSLAGWLVAFKASSAIGEQIMAPAVLWCAVWSACGLPIAARVATPVFCLYFAIPVWELALPWLQRTTIFVAETTLGWMGVPVHIDGVLVDIPEGTFKIAEGCAGKNFFVVALAIGALCASMSRLKSWRALAFMSTTAVLALVMNWVRVDTVIYAGHMTDMTSYLVAREHISFGWGLFAVLAVIIALLARRLGTSVGPSPAGAHPGGELGARRPLRVGVAICATITALVISPIAVDHVRASEIRVVHREVLVLPRSNTSAWSGPSAPDVSWSPHFAGAAAAVRGAYRGQTGKVEVFIADYTTEQAGAKLVGFQNALFAKNWTSMTANPLGQSLRLSQAPYRIKLVRAETPLGEQWIVSYVYEVRGLVTSSPVLAQLAYGVLSWAGSVPARLVAAAVPCDGSCAEAQLRLQGFWSMMGSRVLEARAVDTQQSG